VLSRGDRDSQDSEVEGQRSPRPGEGGVKAEIREMARRTARYPDRKISETFLHFAAPILHLSSETHEDQARKALQVAFTVWNAVIFADVFNDHRHLNEIRRLTAEKPDIGLPIEDLIARKRELFAGDERLIGNWELTRTEDGFNLRADARDPHSLTQDPA
jgi:hypothetical protein